MKLDKKYLQAMTAWEKKEELNWVDEQKSKMYRKGVAESRRLLRKQGGRRDR